MEGKPHACTLEINVISGQNICVGKSPMAEDVYVVVRAESLNCCTTKMVKENGGVLAWNEKMLLDIPAHARSVTFEVQCKKYKGARPIGVARIALSDFLGGSSTSTSTSGVPQQSCLQMLSYGLRDWDGRRNGVIHFSVRVATPEETKPANKGITTVSSSGFEVMGFKVDQDQEDSSHVVIGIPVWWNYPSINV